MTDDEQLERQRVELVFRLGGGELNDDPWSPYYVTDTFGEARQYVVAYNYDGVPEWAEEEYPNWAWGTHRTMVDDILFGAPADAVYDEQGIWEKVATYATSGESDCYCAMVDDNAKPSPVCPLCEGDGYVYIGDGWAEIVYKLQEREDDDE